MMLSMKTLHSMAPELHLKENYVKIESKHQSIDISIPVKRNDVVCENIKLNGTRAPTKKIMLKQKANISLMVPIFLSKIFECLPTIQTSTKYTHF